jgi:hypothetical protein
MLLVCPICKTPLTEAAKRERLAASSLPPRQAPRTAIGLPRLSPAPLGASRPGPQPSAKPNPFLSSAKSSAPTVAKPHASKPEAPASIAVEAVAGEIEQPAPKVAPPVQEEKVVVTGSLITAAIVDVEPPPMPVVDVVLPPIAVAEVDPIGATPPSLPVQALPPMVEGPTVPRPAPSEPSIQSAIDLRALVPFEPGDRPRRAVSWGWRVTVFFCYTCAALALAIALYRFLLEAPSG